MMRGFLPKMSLREPMTGWKTVEVRRKDVPDQKASIAVPFSSFAMIYVVSATSSKVQPGNMKVVKGLTGRATASEVASRAAMRVMTDNEANAR